MQRKKRFNFAYKKTSRYGFASQILSLRRAAGAASQQGEALGRGSCRALVELRAEPCVDVQMCRRADVYTGDQLQTFVVFLVY